MTDQADAAAAATDRALAERLRSAIRWDFERGSDLQRRARHLNARCLIGIGAEQLLLEIRAGCPTIAERIELLGSWDFAIRANAQAWAALWQPVPAPGTHDLFALCKGGAMRIEGNLGPLMANLQYFKDLVTLPREGDGR